MTPKMTIVLNTLLLKLVVVELIVIVVIIKEKLFRSSLTVILNLIELSCLMT